ncbi:MAG: glycosyltransferase, partial [Syntrophales bacterium LBB04]|nr:glycosyltransferase [Syntrophales bacterium LBB04]
RKCNKISLMNNPSLFNQYRQCYAVGDRWKLIAPDPENISQIVVIPAYAEKDMLFSTLGSLAQNQSASLEYSFILCVINNKKKSPDDVKINNQQTLEYLQVLAGQKRLHALNIKEDLRGVLQHIVDAGLKLGYVDASSAGCELPENAGGVGMARKIGMDKALILLQKSSSLQKLIISLDADTLVQSNYLAVINNFFTRKIKTAVLMTSENYRRRAQYAMSALLGIRFGANHLSRIPSAQHVCSADACRQGNNRRRWLLLTSWQEEC